MINKIFSLTIWVTLVVFITSFESKKCIQESDIKEALEYALSYDDKLFDLHIDSSRLPVKIIINRHVRKKIPLKVFEAEVSYVKKRDVKNNDYVEISMIKKEGCSIEVKFYVKKENSEGHFKFEKDQHGSLKVIQKDIYEY